MKSVKILIGIILVILSLTAIKGNELVGHEFQISEDDEQSFVQFATEGDIDTVWGAINSDSVRIGLQQGFSMNMSIGTVAAWNVTTRYSRIIDGIRLRSINNTGAVGDLLEGGVGYDFATFKLVGHSHYLYFIVDAFENYTSSLLTTTTTTPVPDILFKEWGVINYASKEIDGRVGFTQWNNPGEISITTGRVNASKIIDGISLTNRNRTVESAEILEGGIGFNFFRFRVVGNRNFLDFFFRLYENGTYLETRERVYGTITNNTKLDEKRVQNHPGQGGYASGNATFSTSGTIEGIRITYLNYTDGSYLITSGGLNTSSVSFDFSGKYAGEAYDFNIEIFGNNAVPVKISLIFVILSSILLTFFK